MDNYIIKEIAIERIKRVKPHVVMSEYGVGYERGLKDAIGILNATPAAGVQPMKRGKWLINPNISHEPFCSECKETPCYRSFLPKFCPNCGAKMDGDAE